MSAKKPVKPRDIYEATQDDYDTVGYRRKVCDQWITFQQEHPVIVHQPSDLLESNAPRNATPANPKRKRSNHFPADKHTMPKQSKRDDGEQIKPIDFTGNLTLDDFEDPFVGFDFEFSNDKLMNEKTKTPNFDYHMKPPPETKHRSTKVQTTTQSRNYKQSQLKELKDLNHSTKRTEMPGYKNDDDAFAGFEWSPVKQHAQFGSGSKPKKKPETYRDDYRDAFDDFFENPLNPATKNIERKRHNDKESNSERNLFDSKPSPKHVIYKRVEKSSYSMFDATPIQLHSNDGFCEETKLQKMPRDDFMFKKPDIKRSAYEKMDNANGAHRDRRKNQQIDQNVMFSNEIREIKPLVRRNMSNAFHELKKLQQHSLTQPTVFNIKINKLIIKTD